jgi:LacI family transcriptional regulator
MSQAEETPKSRTPRRKNTPAMISSPCSSPLRKRPTLIEVAALSGVKVSTASEILNHKSNCWASKATRQKVFKAAKDLNYRTNLAAKSLRVGSSSTIGFIVVAYGGGGRIRGLDSSAAAQSFSVITSFNPNQDEYEDRQIRHLLDRGVDGMVVYPAENSKCIDTDKPYEHKELKELIAREFPVVTFDGEYLLDFKTDDVRPDYAGVGKLQAHHLIEQGRKRIVLANTLPEATINRVRQQAIQEELAKAGLPPPLLMNIVHPADSEIPEWQILYRQIEEFVEKKGGTFDAIIGVDTTASLSVRALARHSFRVPQDIAVVGAGNTILSTHGTLPLTTVDTKDFWLGEQAFLLLRNRFETPGTIHGFRQVVSTPELLVRDSSYCERMNR